MSQVTQTYNDGLVRICVTENVAEPGDMPIEALIPRFSLRFEERTVGINRYYAAAQANVQIDRLIRCQRIEEVSTQDTAKISGIDYAIRQIQYPTDVTPPSMDLALERVMQSYERQQ